MTTRFQTALKPVTLAVATLILVGCSSLNPQALQDKAVRDRAAADRVKMLTSKSRSPPPSPWTRRLRARSSTTWTCV